MPFLHEMSKNKDLITSASDSETCFYTHFHKWQQIPTAMIFMSSSLYLEDCVLALCWCQLNYDLACTQQCSSAHILFVSPTVHLFNILRKNIA